MAQVVDCLPSKHEAQSSNSSPIKKKVKFKKGKRQVHLAGRGGSCL
jgi:hypothetical protein